MNSTALRNIWVERFRLLASGNSSGSHALARKLDLCKARTPCGCAACPLCHATWTKAVAEALECHLARFEKLWLVTVILSDPELRQDKLSNIDPRPVVQRTRMVLRRHGLSGRIMLGALEADWQETDGVWEPHIHLLIAGEKPDVAKLKARLRERRGDVYRPVQVKAVDNLPGAIAYVLKMSSKRKVRSRTNGRIQTYRYPLRGKRLQESLRWYGRPPAHFALLQGLRISGDELKLLL